MALLSQLTTPADIRAVFGVSEIELPDAVLNLPMYDVLWDMSLSEIHVELPALIDLLLEKEASAPDTMTRYEKQLLGTVRVFSAYAISKDLLANAKLFTPKRITDGRAEVERFADSFLDMRDGLLSMYLNLLKRIRFLLRMLGYDAPEPVAPLMLGVAGLAVNPITGE